MKKKQKLSPETKNLIIQKLENFTRILNEKQINLMYVIMSDEKEVKRVLKICNRKKYSKDDLMYKWELVERSIIDDQNESYKSFMFFDLIGKTNYHGEMSIQQIYFDFCHDDDNKICVFWGNNFDAWFSKRGFDCFHSDHEISLKDFLKEITKAISFEESILNFLRS